MASRSRTLYNIFKGRVVPSLKRHASSAARRGAKAAYTGAGYAVYRGRERAEARLDAERERKLRVEIARKERKAKILALQRRSAELSKRLRA